MSKQFKHIDKKEIVCAICHNTFFGHLNHKYCGDQCREIASKQQQGGFKVKNPKAHRRYNRNRRPNYWRDKQQSERLEIVTSLGGKCCVCDITNPNWLHVDYIPTMQGTGLRHPKHKSYVLRHVEDFRLLCANHHYELSITGKIEGTDITQPRSSRPKLLD